MDLTSVFSLGEAVIDRLFPDKVERAAEMRKLEELRQKGDLAYLEAHVKLMKGQLDINLAEAKHKSIFVSGWRPAVGWVCVSILAFNYIGIWLIEYLTSLVVAFTTIEAIPMPAKLSMTELWPVLLGMLGMGTMRTVDKVKGVSTDKIK